MEVFSPPILKEIARSFAMTLRVLPTAQRPSITMAYVLARLADTLSDSGLARREDRLAALRQWRAAIHDCSIPFARVEWPDCSEGDLRLLSSAPLVLQSWHAMSAHQREPVLKVLTKLMAAMEWDLTRFSGVFDEAPPMTPEDFDWYCYHIAGCVGEFWIDIFQLDPDLRPLAVSYGKALQRINILRDIQSDRERGRWYLTFPKAAAGSLRFVHPEQRGDSSGDISKDWLDFLKTYAEETKRGLGAGETFCNRLSKLSPRLRWASYLPASIGIETLKILVRRGDAETPVKISHRLLRDIVWQTSWRSALGFEFRRCRQSSLSFEVS